MSWLERIRGRWRLWLGYCPACNLDAPALYDCQVCEYYQGPWPAGYRTLALWRKRWASGAPFGRSGL